MFESIKMRIKQKKVQNLLNSTFNEILPSIEFHELPKIHFGYAANIVPRCFGNGERYSFATMEGKENQQLFLFNEKNFSVVLIFTRNGDIYEVPKEGSKVNPANVPGSILNQIFDELLENKEIIKDIVKRLNFEEYKEKYGADYAKTIVYPQG